MLYLSVIFASLWIFYRVKMQMVDRKVQVSFVVYVILFLCEFVMQIYIFLKTVVNISAWISAIVWEPVFGTPFYMSGIWTPVLVFIQRIFVLFIVRYVIKSCIVCILSWCFHHVFVVCPCKLLIIIWILKNHHQMMVT